MADTKGTLVTGVIGEDVHIMGIRIVEHALRARGIQDCLPGGSGVSGTIYRGCHRDKC